MAKSTPSPLTFERVHEVGRHLMLETLGVERDTDALASLTGDLFDALPAQVRDEIWSELGARHDRLNAFLAYGDEPRRERSRSAIGPGGRLTELRGDDPLRAVPLPLAFEILTGTEIPRSGTVRCPLPEHEDRTPSCRVAEDVFFCHGCLHGGSIYDLGAYIYGIEPRGAGFLEIRRRLAEDLLGRAVA